MVKGRICKCSVEPGPVWKNPFLQQVFVLGLCLLVFSVTWVVMELTHDRFHGLHPWQMATLPLGSFCMTSVVPRIVLRIEQRKKK